MPAKSPSKKGGKTALLKAQENLCAEMVLTAGRTASVLKAHRGEERQKALEMKMKKRDLKALCTTYQTHPEVFDSEPAGLLSDADMDEDNMFSDRSVPTRLPNQQALTYSMSKTPPTVLAQKPTSKIHTKPQKASTTVVSLHNDSDSEGSSDSNDLNNFVDRMDQDDTENESDCGADNTPDDHDEVAKASSPLVVGTKHKLEDSKASDFDDVTKDLLTTATSIYRCLVVTRAPFPETLIIETKLAKDAWHEASNMAELTIQLTPSLVKMMTRRTSQVREELKTKMRVLTASFFGFRGSRSIPAIKQNRDLAEALKEGSCFVFKDWEMKRGIYKTGLIQEVVNDMWFANRIDEGIVYAKISILYPFKPLRLYSQQLNAASTSG
ncbi:uncharacterized protein F5891DRAFT_1175230 [Suillus fuscotomentosus]|uniref:DUF6532 domain-containing protein n=1 Tax=Suillus fuscotomentosus TaxID=1912939 RepID=A0AAD4HHB8_9AGAM|nr:uncharacterized protein F5891DRAFT_1175230 [Suillus fuscotomentosus]KAG1896502.1 hypothetical protein F5891DRAFT_1175230 [Suillus fuscotomentosus]